MFHTRYIVLTTCILFTIILSGCGGAPTTQQNTPAPVRTITPQNISTPSQQPTPSPSPTQAPLALRHIFYIMMENHAANEIFGNTGDAPYLNQLANSYGIATQYFGVTHPSLPNYLAAISGDFQGIWDDCPAGASVTCAPQAFGSLLTPEEASKASSTPHLFNGQTLVDQLEAHHLTWKAYMQSLPSVGFSGGYAGLYGEKHDPFMYFSDIRNNPARMQRIVPFTQFAADMQSSAAPNFAWISPDACSDMHGVSAADAQSYGIPDCATYNGLIARGDAFIHTIVPEIMSSPAWTEGSAIIIAWDENNGGSDGCCKTPTGVNGATLGGGNVPLIVITSKTAHHQVIGNSAFNHYSLLAAIEQVWGLGCLANSCGLAGVDVLGKLFG